MAPLMFSIMRINFQSLWPICASYSSLFNMAEPIPAGEQSNYETFRDCMSEPIIKVLAAPIEKPKPKKNNTQLLLVMNKAT